MKTKKKSIGLIVLFLLGLLILLYPTISDRWNQYRADQLISQYRQVVDGRNDSYEKEWEAAKKYNAAMVGGEVPDAFASREDHQDEEYDNLLNVEGNAMMGFIEIPTISVELPIYHYTTDEVLEKGVGHLFGSSLPIGGESTHAVLSAHRGLPNAKMFTDLDRLKKGNQFYLHILDEILAYEVDQVVIVEPDEVQSLKIEEGEDYVTLFTCTPYSVNTQRLLVRGKRVAYDEAAYQSEEDNKLLPPISMILPRILCVVIGILMALVLVKVFSKTDKKKTK